MRERLAGLVDTMPAAHQDVVLTTPIHDEGPVGLARGLLAAIDQLDLP